MPDDLPFRCVTGYPPHASGPAAIARLLDGLGFRFYWATEGLAAEHYGFTPGSSCMRIGELVGHIWGLTNWVYIAVFGQGEPRPADALGQRSHILDMLHRLRERFASLSDAELEAIAIDGRPFWHLLNGPLADALTHVGQINVFRRLAGAPARRSQPFTCTPPDEEDEPGGQ